jgi:hypothetical protein
MNQEQFNEFVYEFAKNMMNVTSHLSSEDVIKSLESLVASNEMINNAITYFKDRQAKDFIEWEIKQYQLEVSLKKEAAYNKGIADAVFDKQRGVQFSPTSAEYSEDYISGYNSLDK